MFEKMRLSGWRQPSVEDQAAALSKDGSSRVRKANEELIGVEQQLAQLKRLPRTPANRMRVQQLLAKRGRLNQSLMVFGNGTSVVESGAEMLDQVCIWILCAPFFGREIIVNLFDQANYLKTMNSVLKGQSKAMQAARNTVTETEGLLESVSDAQQDIGQLNSEMGSVIGAFTEQAASNTEFGAESYSVDSFYEEGTEAEPISMTPQVAPSAFSPPISLPSAGSKPLPAMEGMGPGPGAGAGSITEQQHGDPGQKVAAMLRSMSRN